MNSDAAFHHVLITRFNLRLGWVSADKRGQPVRTAGWLSDRIALFERYCLPSVLHQTRRDFRWLILLDETSGTELRERAVRWVDASDERITPVYLPPVRDRRPIAAAVNERVPVGARWLITTRLDSDDALHEDAIAAIRARVDVSGTGSGALAQSSGPRVFLNLRLGFAADGARARVISDKSSPFVSLVESRTDEPFTTVHCGLPHSRVRRFAPVRQIEDRPLWLRVIHGRNAVNAGAADRRSLSLLRPADVALRLGRLRRAMRRATWPKERRRVRTMAEIAGRFHVGEYPATRPAA